ncbi:hypothetical protein [Candidatus Poriferisodalis sp.]|uniref:hypothetical protein n=1 Tax=Candidatus Poriferisodalis sp. TaxID=3101277 RepID=UPI003B5B2463
MRRGAAALLITAVVLAGVVLELRPAEARVDDLSVSFTGGSCSRVNPPTSGYEREYSCSVQVGSSFSAVGSADSNQSDLEVIWSSTGGVSDSENRVDATFNEILGLYSASSTATIRCSSDGTATLTGEDRFDTDEFLVRVDCLPLPEVEITGFDGDSEQRTSTGAITLSDTFVVSPSGASCSHSRVSGVAAIRRWTDNNGSGRGLSVEISAISGTARVRVTCTATGYTTASADADFTVRRPDVEITGWDGESRDAPGAMSDDFDVSPVSATCTASRVSGTITSSEVTIDISGAGGQTRNVDVTTTATGSVSVRVNCTHSQYESASDTATFRARRIAVSISGFSGDSGNVGDVLSDSIRVTPDTASCTSRRVSGISSSDIYTDVSYSNLLPAVEVESTVAGTVTIEVRCTNAEYNTGTARAVFTFAALPDVEITGWDGDSRDGPGDMFDDFDVFPLSAACTASRVSGTITSSEVTIDISGAGGQTRYVDVTTTATGSVSVRVNCTHSQYESASDTATFTARRIPVSISGWDGDSGNVGDELTDAFRVDPTTANCTARRASGISSSDLTIGITGTGLVRTVTVESDEVGTATVEVRCTNAEYNTGTARAVFTFAALPDVEITGWDGDSRDGPGDMFDDFDVFPLSAACTASRVSGTITSSEVTIDISGAGGQTRYVDVTTTATGSVSVRVDCSRSGYNSASDTSTFTARRIPVSISGWDGDSGNVGDELTDAFRVDPTTANCTARRASGISSSDLTIGITGTGLVRTVTVESDEVGTATVEVRCTNAEYNTGTARAVFTFAALPDVEITGWDGDSRDAPGAMSDDFDVTPVSAICAAARSGGDITSSEVTIDISGAGTGTRDVDVTTTATGSVSVRVNCSRSGYNSASDTSTFTVRRIGVSISGWDGDSGNIGETLTDAFRVNPTTADCAASRSRGIAASALTIEITGTGLVRTLTVESDEVGTATVEVSCTHAEYDDGSAEADFVFAALPDVEIAGLDNVTAVVGTLSDDFTVSPASAECTATTTSTISASAQITGSGTSDRTLSVTVTEAGEVSVEVTCARSGHNSASQTVTFTAERIPPVDSVGITVVSGGECTRDSTPDMGIDDQWDCWMGEGRPFVVEATATGPMPGLSLSWSAMPGVTKVDDDQGAVQTDVVVTTTIYSRSNEVELACTSDGTATVETSVDGTVEHTGLLDIDCRPVIVIDGFDGGLEPVGPISDDFDVTPQSANCSVSRVSGPAVMGLVVTGHGLAARTVSMTTSGAGTTKVEVTCTHSQWATTSVTAEFVATDDSGCSDDLGSLGAGTVTRADSLDPADGCLSWKRGSPASPHYARRYTLRVPVLSTITVDAGSSVFDTYLYVLRGSGSAAVVVAENDNAVSGGGTDAQVKHLAVERGLTYVIEVTSTVPRATGAFTLTVATTLGLPPVEIIGLGDHGEIGTGELRVSEDFEVLPADAVCTATSSIGIATVADGAQPGERTVSVPLTAPASASVTVTCRHDDRSETSRSVTLVAAHPVTDVTVSALSGGTCTKATGTPPPSTQQAYDCEMTNGGRLELEGKVQGPLATHSLAWAGSGDVTAVQGALENADIVNPLAIPVEYSRVREAALACGADGSAKLTVTGGGVTHVTQINITCTDATEVVIEDFDNAEDFGGENELVRVTGGFTVTPDTAECSPTATSSTTTAELNPDITPDQGANVRTVELELVADNNAQVTVICEQAGIGSDTAMATFTATEIVEAAFESVSLTVSGEGECDDLEASEVDDEVYTATCRVARGEAVTLTATATAIANTIELDWSTEATEYLTLVPEPMGPLMVPDADLGVPPGPNQRQGSRTASLRCTGTGDISLSGVAKFVDPTEMIETEDRFSATLTVQCQTLIEITDVEDASESGDAGESVEVSGSFTVTPSTADCEAVSGTASVTGSGSSRTVSATLTVPASEEVTVRCTQAAHWPGEVEVELVAQDLSECVDGLGTLRAGATRRSGTIAELEQCTSSHPPGSGTHYAKRHTFTLNGSGWVTIELSLAESNTEVLDTYLVLLDGDSADGSGAKRDEHDNLSSTDSDSRLSTVQLAPGNYTIEATTADADATGDYELVVTTLLADGFGPFF